MGRKWRLCLRSRHSHSCMLAVRLTASFVCFFLLFRNFSAFHEWKSQGRQKCSSCNWTSVLRSLSFSIIFSRKCIPELRKVSSLFIQGLFPADWQECVSSLLLSCLHIFYSSSGEMSAIHIWYMSRQISHRLLLRKHCRRRVVHFVCLLMSMFVSWPGYAN